MDDLRYRSRRSRYAIFLPWLRPQRYDTFVAIFNPILVRWLPVPTRRTHMNDVPHHMDAVFLEPSTQIWNRRVWTRNYSGERAQNLFTAQDRWLPARTRSSVEACCDLHRARMWWNSCLWFTLFLLVAMSHWFPRYFVLLGTNLLPSRCVHGANRVPWSFLARRNCRTAEFSEFFLVSRLSRFTFCGTVAAPSHDRIFRYSVAAWEDWSLLRPSTRSDHDFLS